MLDKFKQSFREEADELLGQLEITLLELEDSPEDSELLNAAFRAIHTIKGSAGMFGFDAIAKFTHDLENVMDQARSKKIPISKEFVDLALRGRDHIRALLVADEAVPPELSAESETLAAECRAFVGAGGEGAGPAAGVASIAEPKESSAPASPKAPKAATPGKKSSWKITFKPEPGIFKNGTRVLSLIEELSGLGIATVVPHTQNIPLLSEIDPETCYTYWDIFLTTDADENAIRDIFIFVEGESQLKITNIQADIQADLEAGVVPKLGDVLVTNEGVDPAAVSKALASQKKLGQILLEQEAVSPEALDTSLGSQEHHKKLVEKAPDTGIASSIRVASDKLDQLVDLVGELVTLQARLSRTSLDLKDGPLASISEQFERLISQLRDNTMSIRMLPIGSTFNKFRRVVRDLSTDLGKEADLLTEGAETELDKTVIERLNDPLVHIIRNSLDHGIEDPADREKAGKPRKGTVLLRALHSGAYVLISVKDDGAGLNVEAIRAKAVERGLIAPGQELSEAEIHQLILQPGFSTAKKITNVSGRGVGMDVVKREIDTLGGTVMISSQEGAGTEMTLKIPLTLAIIEGLLVSIGGEFYVLPLSSVESCIEIPSNELDVGERHIIPYRGDMLPYINLRTYFEVPGEMPVTAQMVIVNSQDARIGFAVDSVVGQYQTVIKPLGRMYKDVTGVSGATILGDGTVALILDVNRLAISVQHESQQRKAQAS
jgi:two-component system, chemotaxis family, sensor kinase CheA